MVTYATLPAAEQMVSTWAVQQADLVAVQGQRVGTRLDTILPATRLTRLGNPPPEPWEDHPSIQVECWGADQSAAWRLTKTWIAALPNVRGWVNIGGKVWSYEVTAGPYWAPDDPALSKAARYIFTLDLLITLHEGNPA